MRRHAQRIDSRNPGHAHQPHGQHTDVDIGSEGHGGGRTGLHQGARHHQAGTGQHAAQPGQHQHRHDGTRTHGRQQQRERAGVTAVKATRHQRQQRQQCCGVKKEQCDAQQHRPQALRLADKLHTHPHGAQQFLAPQGMGCLLAPPADQDEPGNHRQHCVEQEDIHAAHAGNQGPRNQRAKDARGIHRDAIEPQRRRQLRARHQARNQRGINRPSHGQPHAIGQNQGQQQGRCHGPQQNRGAQGHGDHGHPELRGNEVATAVHNVGHSPAGET